MQQNNSVNYSEQDKRDVIQKGTIYNALDIAVDDTIRCIVKHKVLSAR